ADDSLIATGGSDRNIILWESRSQKSIVILKGHQGIVTSVIFLADKKTLVSASLDSTVRLGNTKTFQEIKSFGRPGDHYWSLAVSTKGDRMAAGTDDNRVIMWNADNGQVQRIIPHKGMINSVSFSPDDRSLAVGGTDVEPKIWDPVTGDLKHVLVGQRRG